jgi:hypothetical protein
VPAALLTTEVDELLATLGPDGDRPVRYFRAPNTAAGVGGIMLTELLIHGADPARALRRPEAVAGRAFRAVVPRDVSVGLDGRMSAHRVALALPDIETLRRRSRALATLDAILSPEWESRYFSFDSRWGPDEEMASMRNGAGDAYSIVFSPPGVFIRGFDHESVMSPYRGGRLWPGLVDSVPAVFAGSLGEPAFSTGDGLLEATVCLWRGRGDDRWHTGDVELPDGDDPDGADGLFRVLLDGTGGAYRDFAEDYYEVSIDRAAVADVLALGPLTDELVRRLNPDAGGVAELEEDLAEIGYPPARP